jgi:hypothetical protein
MSRRIGQLIGHGISPIVESLDVNAIVNEIDLDQVLERVDIDKVVRKAQGTTTDSKIYRNLESFCLYLLLSYCST